MTTHLTDEQVIASRNALETLKRPHLWPGRGKTVNLKRGTEEFALCSQARDGSYRVWPYKDASYELGDAVMFMDAEGVVDAGWVID